jgi:hypothetical protein
MTFNAYARCVIMLSVAFKSIMLSVAFKSIMLSGIMLSAIILSIIMMSVEIKSLMLSIIMLSVIMLNVVILNVVAPPGKALKQHLFQRYELNEWTAGVNVIKLSTSVIHKCS